MKTISPMSSRTRMKFMEMGLGVIFKINMETRPKMKVIKN
jgi:hypothetical protein